MTYFSCNSCNFKIFVSLCRVYFFVCVVSCRVFCRVLVIFSCRVKFVFVSCSCRRVVSRIARSTCRLWLLLKISGGWVGVLARQRITKNCLPSLMLKSIYCIKNFREKAERGFRGERVCLWIVMNIPGIFISLLFIVDGFLTWIRGLNLLINLLHGFH